MCTLCDFALKLSNSHHSKRVLTISSYVLYSFLAVPTEKEFYKEF